MDDIGFYVIQRQPCPECDATGEIEDSIWSEYWAWLYRLGEVPRPEQSREWWSKQGYDAPPPLQTVCIDCGGLGQLECQIPLVEALQAIGICSARSRP